MATAFEQYHDPRLQPLDHRFIADLGKYGAERKTKATDTFDALADQAIFTGGPATTAAARELTQQVQSDIGTLVYAPNLVSVQGNYDDVNRLCAEVAAKHKWGFVNINLRAYYAEGSKTLGFEIAEQLGWKESKVVARFWITGLVLALFALTTLKLR